MGVSTALYKNDKLLLVGYWKYLEYFVEKLKRLNPKWVNRTDFTIKCGDEILKQRKRR